MKQLDQRMGPRSLMLGLLVMATALMWVPAGAGAAAAPEFQVTEFGASFLAPAGGSQMQAGGHPDITTNIQFATTVNAEGKEAAIENPKDILVDLPAGLIGNPTVAAVCPAVDLAQQGVATCEPDTQVGLATLKIGLGTPEMINFPVPVYNVDPPRGVAARFGFNAFSAVTVLDAVVDAEGGYHLQMRSLKANQGLGVGGVRVELSGAAAASGDAFLTAPTSCSGTPLSFGLNVSTWQNPERILTRSNDRDLSGAPLSMVGCGRVPFSPTMSFEPTNREAGAPTGLRVKLVIPQSDDPNGIAQSDLRDADVTLPPGMTISPPSAGGLGVCTDTQLGLGSIEPSTCPESSKLGTVKVVTPILAEPLAGSIYLRPQASSDPESGEMFRLALEMANPARGIDIKLPGTIKASTATGQLVASFDENPQFPFSELELNFKSGPRAALVNPPTCGTITAGAHLTGWSGAETTLKLPMEVNSGCAAPKFSPALEAGTTNPVGGSFSPFNLRVTQASGEQNLSKLSATLPRGLLAKLAGVTVCGDAQAATGDCPAGSQVGTTTVGAGAGSNPIYVPEAGKAPTAVYLAGPYKGAPYSLVVKVPAEAGPFSLGTVVVRNALRIDPITTQVTAESDPLPQILAGVPISYRDVRVEVDRNEFTVNPTSCGEQQVTSTLTSAGGATASPASRFQVAGCERLAFKPGLKLQLSGQTRRTGNPAIKAVLTQPKGEDANIAGTTVILPKSMFIDQSHVNDPCTRVQFNEGECPAKSVLGTATAWSPLLEKPLAGPVYFRSNGGERKLPDLVADLHGQINVTLVGFIDSIKVGKESSRVRTRFQNVPDAPVSRFVLQLKGGKRGLIENSKDLCRTKPKASVKTTGQNGKTFDFEQKMNVSCGRKGKKK